MRTIRSVLPLIVIVLLLTACGGAASLPVADGNGATGAGLPIGAQPNPEPGQGDGGGQAVRDDARIIRTGSMALEVSDLGAALRVARDGIVALGGYIGASTTSNEADKPSAQITYRVPAERWEQALDIMRGLSGLTTKLVNEHTEAVEVTGQVIDLEARLANLRASETALQGIAASATKVTDVLEVQAQLTQTRGQIESLTAELKDLNDRAAYASLTVQFGVPLVAVEVARHDWEPSAAVDEAAAAMVSLLQSLATAAIWFVIVWLPILIVLGSLTLVGLAIARRFGAGRGTRGGPSPTEPIAADA